MRVMTILGVLMILETAAAAAPASSPDALLERGIELRVQDEGLGIDLYVIVDHGVRILEVANNLMSAVAYSVEKHLGIRVLQVNVNVQGIRPPEEQDGGS